MNHAWHPKIGNKLECIHCNRDYISHMDIVACEACGAPRKCDIFGDLKNPKAMLLCDSCADKERKANDDVLVRTKTLIDVARSIDDTITYNGDVFNAKTIALIELKRALDSDESLSVEERKYKFHELLAERYSKLKKVVFQLDKKKEDLTIEQLVIAKNLRSYGDDVRKEIREKIAQADANYAPPIKRVIKAVVKPLEKKSAIDILIDKMMLMNPALTTREDALNFIRTFKKE